MATKTLSSPIFYGGIYLEVFREKNGLADIQFYGFQLAGTAIDQPRRGYPEITIPSFEEFYKNRGGLWRVSDCEELVGVTHRR